MNQNDAKYMEQFASNLWDNFLSKKVADMMASTVKFYRATVDKNNNVSNHILDVSKPFDKSVSVRCTDAVRGANVGDQVLVMQFGEGSAMNRVAVAYGDTKSLCAPEYDGLMNAVTREISLPVKAQMSPGWKLSPDGISAKLVGNILRLSIAVDSANTIQPGDFENKKICTVSITHGGRITKHSNAGNNTSFTGGLAAFYTSGSRVDGTTLSFDFKMSSLAIAGSSWSCYMLFPVAINPEKYI